MKKSCRKIYGYLVIIAICGLIVGLLYARTENRLKSFRAEYEKEIEAGQKQIALLNEEVGTLKKEKDNLKRELLKGQSLGSDLVTTQQAMADLRDIYQMYKSGSEAEAKKQFDKIEPMGFDDTTLAYYEILADLLKK